jgi:hypothetical protein
MPGAVDVEVRHRPQAPRAERGQLDPPLPEPAGQLVRVAHLEDHDGVVEALLVADLGRGHRVPHRLGGTGLRVAEEG